MEQVGLVVVGAGISGLTAAWRALQAGWAASDVLVLEAAPRTGGKLLAGELPGPDGQGITVDLGAESSLARRPEAVRLIREVGLGEDLVHPAVASASVLVRGRLRPMPAGTVMGVPNDPSALQGFLDDAELARVAAEPDVPAPVLDHDVAVGQWVTERFGPAVAQRLVEPLLGGVYAGHAGRLSLQATVPALWPLAQAGGSVLGRLPVPVAPAVELGAGQTAAQVSGGSAPTDGAPAPAPVFAGIRGGVGRLAQTLEEQLTAKGVRVEKGCTVRALERTTDGWRLETGPVPAPRHIGASAVVLAVPPPAAARLLARDCPSAAAELAQIPMASMAVIAAVIPAVQLTGLTGSGILVPPIEGHLIKAATFSSSKWSWVGERAAASGSVVVRISIGRAGEEHDLQLPDDALAAAAVTDLGAVLGRPISPSAVLVQRWGGGLPQYEVGHLGRVARIRAAVESAGRLAVCGAAFDGVGIPACIASAERAITGLAQQAAEQQGPVHAARSAGGESEHDRGL